MWQEIKTPLFIYIWVSQKGHIALLFLVKMDTVLDVYQIFKNLA